MQQDMQQCKHIMHTFGIEMGDEHQKHYKSIELKPSRIQQAPISILEFLPGYWKSLNKSNNSTNYRLNYGFVLHKTRNLN